MADAHKNFAYSTVATAPGRYGTSLVVASGEGGRFPTPPFNATVWPTGAQPTSANAEIVRVTAIDTDNFTIARIQEDTNRRNIVVGDQIAATITNLTLSDAEGTKQTWAPFVMGSGAATSVQTLATATDYNSVASLYVFPITVPQDIRFNQIIVPYNLSLITSTEAISNTYSSLFGLYSLNGNTLSLISSNSFSIAESLNSVSATWNYPTTTHTTGYGYNGFPGAPVTASTQFAAYVTGSRGAGLQFGGNMKLSPDIYWIGLMSLRNTAGTNNFGLSLSGIVGQQINPVNQGGSGASVLIPIGLAASAWTNINTHLTAWWGRHIAGILTATSLTNFSGTGIPGTIGLGNIGGDVASATATILPTVTFVST